MEGQMIQFDRTIFNRTTPNVWRRWFFLTKGILFLERFGKSRPWHRVNTVRF
jgi:hypothetical protein